MGIADAEGFDDSVTQELVCCVLADGQHIHHFLDRQHVLGKPALFYFDDLDQFFSAICISSLYITKFTPCLQGYSLILC